MLLTKEEAVSLVLNYAEKNTINSQIKLNKLLARLNFYMIPVNINFTLNKYGSFSIDTKDLQSNEFYNVASYQHWNSLLPIYTLKPYGKELAMKIINEKLIEILKHEEIDKLRKEINSLSQLTAKEISEEEHNDLLVDEKDKEKLKMRINSVHINMIDLYAKKDKISRNTYANLTMAALIEYCHFLSQYLMQKRFKHIDDMEYDFNADMLDYYFLWNLDKKVIPFLEKEISSIEKDEIVLNRYYQYFVNLAQIKSYPFSLDNVDLRKLVCA